MAGRLSALEQVMEGAVPPSEEKLFEGDDVLNATYNKHHARVLRRYVGCLCYWRQLMEWPMTPKLWRSPGVPHAKALHMLEVEAERKNLVTYLIKRSGLKNWSVLPII